jgi:DNA repair protein RecO (recombination protein O)
MRGFLKTDAFVIGQKEFGEKDKIITLLSEKSGKIKVFAKGIRSVKSRRMGSLQTGNKIKTSLSQSDDRFFLGEVELLQSYENIKKSLILNAGLLSICELTNNLLAENEDNQEVYQLFSETIDNLASKSGVDIIVIFEVKLLQMLGYGMPEKVDKLLAEKNWSEAQKKIARYLEVVCEKKINGLKIFLNND